MIAMGRVPAKAGARRCQQAQFRPRQFAGANQKHGTGLQIEKYRQELHAALTSPTYGGDWNYFLYMSRSMPAKRKLFLLYCSATIEVSPPKTKGPEMHLLDKDSVIDQLRWLNPPEGSLVRQISAHADANAPTMDHPDALEAQDRAI